MTKWRRARYNDHQPTHHYALTRGGRRDVKKATTTTHPNAFTVTTVTTATNDDRTASAAGGGHGLDILFFWVCFFLYIIFLFYLTNNYLRTGTSPTNYESTTWKKGPKRRFVPSFTLQVSFFCLSLSCKLTNVFVSGLVHSSKENMNAREKGPTTAVYCHLRKRNKQCWSPSCVKACICTPGFEIGINNLIINNGADFFFSNIGSVIGQSEVVLRLYQLSRKKRKIVSCMRYVSSNFFLQASTVIVLS